MLSGWINTWSVGCIRFNASSWKPLQKTGPWMLFARASHTDCTGSCPWCQIQLLVSINVRMPSKYWHFSCVTSRSIFYSNTSACTAATALSTLHFCISYYLSVMYCFITLTSRKSDIRFRLNIWKHSFPNAIFSVHNTTRDSTLLCFNFSISSLTKYKKSCPLAARPSGHSSDDSCIFLIEPPTSRLFIRAFFSGLLASPVSLFWPCLKQEECISR